MANEKVLKAAFHEAYRESLNKGNDVNIYTFEMLQALRDMAKADVWPDGTFGDMDCNVWSMFRSMTY